LVTYTYGGLSRVAARNVTPFVCSGQLAPTFDGTYTYGRSPAGRVVGRDDGASSSLIGLDRRGDVYLDAAPERFLRERTRHRLNREGASAATREQAI
jgi:hypothetical protein